MASYATTAEVEAGYRTLDTDETSKCAALLEEAAVIIDAYNQDASGDVKKVVSCRMVRRALGEADVQMVPMGASQGSAAAGGYSQSWTIGAGGSVGELYLSKIEKKLLGVGDRIGTVSPLEEKVEYCDQGN